MYFPIVSERVTEREGNSYKIFFMRHYLLSPQSRIQFTRINTNLIPQFTSVSQTRVRHPLNTASDKRLQRVMVRRHNEGTRSAVTSGTRRPSRGNDFRRGARTRLHLQSLSLNNTRSFVNILETCSDYNIHLFLSQTLFIR